MRNMQKPPICTSIYNIRNIIQLAGIISAETSQAIQQYGYNSDPFQIGPKHGQETLSKNNPINDINKKNFGLA